MKKTILGLAIAGLLFSGYISGVKFFTNACSFGEACPIFWGHPACYFGFAMFLLITIFSVVLVIDKTTEKNMLNAIAAVSFLGILFAGYFTVGELPLLFQNGFSAYFFGLPTCALGLIFYVSIFVLSLVAKARLAKISTQ